MKHRTHEIISFAHDLRESCNTNDPFEIAKKYGFIVSINEHPSLDMTARITRYSGFPTIITINGEYDELSRTILCAHELGHALLHDECINYYAVTRNNLGTDVEYEANLFAVALLFDEEDFNIPLEKMENYTLKTILDINLRKW